MKKPGSGLLPVILVVFLAVPLVMLVPGVTAEEAPAAAATQAADAADGFVAFYFHGNVRCATCRKIEAYSNEAISQAFAAELDSGRLAWRVVNIDEPENTHFIEDFELATRSVVLVEYRDGKVVRWANLDKVWQLVRNKDAFVGYVQDSTRAFIGAS